MPPMLMRWILSFAVALLSLPALAQAPAPGDLVINEIMYDPPAPQPSGNEWIEVLNVSGGTLDLSGLTVSDGGTPSAGLPAGTSLADGAYLVIVDNGTTFAAAYPGVAFVELAGFPTLNNTGDRPALLLSGTEIDAVPYLPSWGGTDASLERRDPLGPSTAASNFGTTTDPEFGTPGEENSLFAPDLTGPTIVSGAVSDGGQTITVTVDEPLDPASVTPGAFSVTGTPTVTAAVYDNDALTVTLTLSGPLDPGTSTVTATNLRDPSGNTTASTSTTVDYNPDLTAPTVVSAAALDAQTLQVTFSEAVDETSAEATANYSVDGGIGAPATAVLQADPTQVVLTLATPLNGPARYRITVQNVEDVAGNAIATETETFFFGQGAVPAERDLVINEFLYDEPTADNPGEFVELFNRSDQTFDLSEFTLNDNTGDDQAISNDPVFIGPGEYAVIVEDGALFAAIFPGVAFIEQPSWSALNNTGDAVVLRYQGTRIDSLTYTTAWGGMDASLERKDPEGPSVRANFVTTTDPRGGTPGEQNSQFAPDLTGPMLVAAFASADGRTVTVTLDEPTDPTTITPAAFTVTGGPTVTAAAYDEAELTVTLTLSAPLAVGTSTITATGLRDGIGNETANTSTTVEFDPDLTAPTVLSAVALDAQTVQVTFSEAVDEASAETAANYSISDGIGTPIMADLQDDPTQVILALAAPLTGPANYTLTVQNVADVVGNAITTETERFFFGEGAVPAARDLVINEFLYDEPTADNPGEFVELFNRSDQTFDLSEFTLNDNTGDDEFISNDPVFIGPGEYAVIVEDGALFAAIFPGVAFIEQPSWSALNNSGDSIVLRYQGTRIDSLTYTTAWGGLDVSLERKDPEGPSVRANFATSTDPRGGTPGEQNSQFSPDVTGPTLLSATASADGRTVTVVLDEPTDPATITPAAFSVTGDPTVTAAVYDEDELTVTLTLSASLAAGTSTITATGLRDGLGNTTETTSTTVVFTPDVQAPSLARATALSATTVRATFSEPVTSASATAATYSVEGGPEVASVAVDGSNATGVTSVILTLASPLADQTLYTLSATGLVDPAGNTSGATSVRFFFGVADTPQAGQVVITEIMYDPINGSDGEYLEVLNTTADRIFDLRAITLDDGDGDGDALSDEAAVLLPGEYLALVRDGDGFRLSFPDAAFVEAGSVISLSNSGEAIVLRAGTAVLDSVFYDPDWHRVELEDATGIALERRDPAGGSNDPANWSSSLADLGGTPSAANSLSISGTPVERETALTITSPFAPTRGEASEITYTLTSEAGLVRARIYDGGGRLVRQLDPGRLSGQTATLVWDGTGDDRRPQRAGIYIVLIEAVDAQGGTTDAIRGAVVLARPE